ncbi:MAG: hypothetical protein K0S76_1987 [Herbinix sp.]|jgi:hypothetical protein|nr:hypothetical protein [Herbinix sp.]
MSEIVAFIAVLLLFVVIVTGIIYKFIPKLLWCIPVVALIVTGGFFLRDIFLIRSEPTFAEKLDQYFHNDWSIGFYLFYLPVFVASVLTTVIAYLIKYIKYKKKIRFSNEKRSIKM